MTGEHAHARPSRFSALLPAAGNQDQIRQVRDASSGSATQANSIVATFRVRQNQTRSI
jgi:hypothetical protein